MRGLRVRAKPQGLVEGVVPGAGLVMVYGKEKSFKTFALLDLALCVAADIPWHGHPVAQGAVVYVLAEGVAQVVPRLDTWGAQHGKDVNTLPIHFVDHAVQLLDTDAVDDLLQTVAGLEPRLIVFDTLGRSMEGGKEKDNDDFHTVAASMDKLRKATGATVAVVHHEGHDGKLPRGASAMLCDLDTVIRVVRTNKGSAVEVRCEAQRDAAMFETINLRAELVTMPAGDTSLVMRDGTAPTPTAKRTTAPKLPRAESQTLRACDRLREQGQPITPANVAPLIRKTNDATRRRLRRLWERENGRYLVRVSDGLYELPQVGGITPQGEGNNPPPDRLPDKVSAVLSGVEVA